MTKLTPQKGTPENREYEVGYRKPPRGGQFQKGKSGNPRGRPRRDFDFEESITSDMNKVVGIVYEGEHSFMTMRVYGLLNLLRKAVQGDKQSMRKVVKLMRQIYPPKDPPLPGGLID